MEDCTGFMELLERVRTESPEASGILERMAVDPKALKKWNFVPATSLSMAFTWQQTPEGHVFWADLNASLTHMTPDPDPMTALGTSAQQATEAFQGLQEASKDLVDLEIAIPAGHATDPAPTPLVRPVLQGGQILNENQRPTGPRIQTITAGQSFARLAPEVHREMLRAMREPDAPGPWYTRLWSWLTGPEDKSLTDSELQEATEQLDRVLRLPWYKRTPALILWLWRLP